MMTDWNVEEAKDSITNGRDSIVLGAFGCGVNKRARVIKKVKSKTKMMIARNLLVRIAVALLPMTVAAMTNPPYDLYGYLADATDNPPLNYMKVCEPGRTGEANASYVVLGISYPRTYQAVSGSYNGDLVVPAYIDGLPVRKVNEAAFIECSSLRSVRFPHTLREIGARAFVDCLQLTNVTFETGIATIGDFAFSNCVSLASITFPKSLSRLGARCFQGCIALEDVYFLGNAPRLKIPSMTDKSGLGESIFRNYGYYERFKVHINRNTMGWIAPYVKGVPEKWPVDYGYMQAHETVEESGGGTLAEETGFVTVVTEIKGGSVAIPETWAAQFPSYVAKFGSDFTASLTKPTGKKDAAGNSLQVWQDYVAGTDPTNPDDTFRATISLESGNPVISWEPQLPAAEAAKRTYTIYGRQSLLSGDWSVVPEGQARNYNFFKVSVEMRSAGN